MRCGPCCASAGAKSGGRMGVRMQMSEVVLLFGPGLQALLLLLLLLCVRCVRWPPKTAA